MRNLFFISLFLICHLYVNGQTSDTLTSQILSETEQENLSTCEIKGTVKDKKTGLPVPFATVFIPYSPIGTPTDEGGNFTLSFDEMPHDTLRVNAMGYDVFLMKLDKEQKNISVSIELEPATALLNEVIIKAGEDPALVLLKKVIEHKSKNDPERLTNYSFEAYNKIEVDLLHLSREQFEMLPIPYLKKLSFIYDNLDTVSGKEPFLPFFLTESLSDFYYQKEPRKLKEYIKATQIRGVYNESINQYLGRINLAVKPYDNFIQVLNKLFVSPIGNSAASFYKYRIVDTQQAYGYNLVRMSFAPQRYGENCFKGELVIVDSVYALQYIQAEIPATANINWIKEGNFYQHYEPLHDTLWFCTKENFTAELSISPELKLPGVIARKTTTYKDIIVNDAQIVNIVNSRKFKADVAVADTVRLHADEFWALSRHDTLSKNEKAIYWMFDTLERSKEYNRFKNMVKFLATGTKEFGPIELGPYWSIYSYNTIEGNRFRFSMGTTPTLFKDVYLNGYVAYGTQDKVFKYNANALWLLDRKPRMYLYASYTKDIDRTVSYYDKVGFDNIFSLGLRKKDIPWKLIFSRDAKLEFYKEYFSGFSHLLALQNKTYDPYEPLPSTTIFKNDEGIGESSITNSEVSLRLRYAHKEKFAEGRYYRVSLGSKYPIVEVKYAIGIKGILGSDYDYRKVSLAVSDNVKIAPLGSLYFNVFCGKYFGTLPYVLLENHPGNENKFYNKNAFNLMYRYEYLSDQYAGINLEHSLGGGLFNYIPLIKKLQLRQFWTAKGLIGNLSDANSAYNLDKGYPFKTLHSSPYIEVGTGVENIFNLLRIDFVWRLTPQPTVNEPKSKYFGIFGSFRLNF